MSKKLNVSKRNFWNSFSKYSSSIIAFFVSASLFVILGFILYKSILGFKIYGIENILFSNKLEISSSSNNKNVSFWLPFSITLLTTIIALLIAVPIGIKTAIFIKFRVQKKYQKSIRIICEILSGIPSVIFGLFASKSLGELFKLIGINSYSVINGSVMLSFMIVPTIIAMSLNSLNNVDNNLFINPIAMGNSKTNAIYKIYLKSARNGIIVAVILAMGRAIGETTSLAMILQNQSSYTDVYNNGLLSILNSDLKPISVIIATNMFGENSNENVRSLLFVFGFILFIFIMIFNVIIFWISREKIGTSTKLDYLFSKIGYFCFFIPNLIKDGFEWLTFKLRRKSKFNSYSNIVNYIRVRTKDYKLKNLYSYYKVFWEIVSISIVIIFVAWIILMISSSGIYSISNYQSTIFNFTDNSTGQSFLNTCLIILIAILISLPISLITAIYISEYLKSKAIKKIINFFLDSLGSTPSILFGMFGVIFYIETLGLTSSGTKGFSLIAGALTVILIIIPSFTRGLQETIVQIPKDIRLNSLALGSSKIETIFKLIIPLATTGIITSTIFSIGRILSETTPLFLTAGLTSSSVTALDRPGQTLTTRIYAQLFNPNIVEGEQIMFEVAFVTLILITTLIIIGYVIIPNNKKILSAIGDKLLLIKHKSKKEMFLTKG